MNTVKPPAWIYESSPSLSEPDDNELDTGFGGQLNYGLKLEDSFEFLEEPLIHHNSPGQIRRDEMHLPLNNEFNRRPKVESVGSQSDLEYQGSSVLMQNNTPDAQMDIYRDFILRHLIQDIATTCSKLTLPTDPNLWTPEQTRKWIVEACEQFTIHVPQNLSISGKEMMEMTQEEFLQHIPNGGDIYAQFQLWKTAFESYNAGPHKLQTVPNVSSSVSLIDKSRMWGSHLTDSETAAPATHRRETILHSNSPAAMSNEHLQNSYYSGFPPPPQHQHSVQIPVDYQLSMVNQQHGLYNQTSSFQCNDPVYYPEYVNSNVMASPSESDKSNSSSIVDEDLIDSCSMRFGQRSRLAYDNGIQSVPYLDMGYDSNTAAINNTPMNCPDQQPQNISGMPNFSSNNSKTGVYPSASYAKNNSGSIHLWHFIRELLDKPEKYSDCVRWVDRVEGTFKIESSATLARLWGNRKNRSAMNYDKLSRSLRQYYKKRIIQKPAKKQRLVYKFLAPYHH